MNRYAEILEYQPFADGYRRVEQHGDWESTTTVSREGLERNIAIARQHERWDDSLAAATETLPPLCAEHGLPIAEFSWDLNDYICEPEKEPRFVDWLLDGWHEVNEYGPFCVPSAAHSVPGGLILYAW